MASIPVPSYTRVVYEGDPVQIDIPYVLTASDTLVQYTITSSVSLDGLGITISGTLVQGAYVDFFEKTGTPLLIDYRDRSTGTVQRVNGFSSLPEPSTCDVVKLIPPGSLTQDIVYTATLVYDETVTTGGNPETGVGGTTTVVRKTISLPVTQTVKGSYEKWGQRLRQFIAESGHFPSIQ